MRLALLFVLFLAGAPDLRAQGYPTQIREEDPALKKKAQAEAEKAAAEARKRLVPALAVDVTYEQIMARPDDIDLNFRYALSLVKMGQLRLAAATLERILMVNPNLPKVRLFYAVVLFRLDSTDEAEKELKVLKAEKMPEGLRAEIDQYLHEIHKRRRNVHFNVSLAAGLDFDENRNAASASGQNLLRDIPVILNADSTRKNDVAKIMIGGLSATYDPGFQAGHQAFASYNYYRAEQTRIRTLNLQSHAVNGGLILKTRWIDITPSYDFGHILLTQTTYIRSHGPRLAVSRAFTPRLSAFAQAGWQSQLYNRTLILPVGHQRTGEQIQGGAGMSYVLTGNMSLALSFTHINQGAQEKFNAYQRESANLAHTWIFRKGQFLLTSAIINVDHYEQPEIAISQLYRKDSTYRGRLTYGIPLTLIAKPLKSFLWTFSYEYYHALSNIRNYSYSNNKVSGLLTYKWAY